MGTSQSVCAVKTDGTLWAWGNDMTGQLGQETTDIDYSSPVQVGSLTNWESAQMGRFHMSMIKTDGTLWSVGYKTYLGNNDPSAHVSSPIQIGALTDWSKVGVGQNGTIAVKDDGSIWSWGKGFNKFTGFTTDVSSPTQIGSLTDWSTLGSQHSSTGLAIKTDGTLWAWGEGSKGQLGNSTETDDSSPTMVGTDIDWAKVSGNKYHVLAIKVQE